LQRTELVNEAFVRLLGRELPESVTRAHFLAMAAQQMRQILIDHARRRNRLKRGGGAVPLEIDLADERLAPTAVDVIALDAAMARLAGFDDRKSKVLEMHFFGGMTQEEIAEVLGTHVNTVARDLRLARAWLRVQLGGPKAEA
jgi:RNA polymerase sigma factor (TIGR02999 family)